MFESGGGFKSIYLKDLTVTFTANQQCKDLQTKIASVKR